MLGCFVLLCKGSKKNNTNLIKNVKIMLKLHHTNFNIILTFKSLVVSNIIVSLYCNQITI